MCSRSVCRHFGNEAATSRCWLSISWRDACGTFSQTKREVGLLRMLHAGVITTGYASLMVEILKDNSRPDAGAIYGAIDMPWAKLVGQIAQAYGR